MLPFFEDLSNERLYFLLLILFLLFAVIRNPPQDRQARSVGIRYKNIAPELTLPTPYFYMPVQRRGQEAFGSVQRL